MQSPHRSIIILKIQKSQCIHIILQAHALKIVQEDSTWKHSGDIPKGQSS